MNVFNLRSFFFSFSIFLSAAGLVGVVNAVGGGGDVFQSEGGETAAKRRKVAASDGGDVFQLQDGGAVVVDAGVFFGQYEESGKDSERCHNEHSPFVSVFKNKKTGRKVFIKADKTGDKAECFENSFQNEIAFYKAIHKKCNEAGRQWPEYLSKFNGIIREFKDGKDALVLDFIEAPYGALCESLPRESANEIVGVDGFKRIGYRIADAFEELHNEFKVAVGSHIREQDILFNPETTAVVLVDFEGSTLLDDPLVVDKEGGHAVIDEAFDLLRSSNWSPKLHRDLESERNKGSVQSIRSPDKEKWERNKKSVAEDYKCLFILCVSYAKEMIGRYAF